MRPEIVDAAVAIVRSRGLDALTVRAVAEEANYGKSTIHAIIGTKEELLEAVADRLTEMHVERLAALRGTPEDTSLGRFLCTADVVLDSPELAEAMFGRPRPIDLVAWSKQWIAQFSRELADGIEGADEAALAEALLLAHRQIVTVIPTIAEAGDREFGARILRETLEPLRRVAAEIEAHRATGTTADENRA